jgi:RNA polymerase sigma-70 factor (ECF subfamily)
VTSVTSGDGPIPNAVTDTFEEHRAHLFQVAYRMLGSAAEAEDVVQEAYLRWEREDEAARSPRALLTTITTRLAIDRLRSAQHRRETYVGPWLPEPIVTSEDPYATVELADSLTFAFLVMLDRLKPLERAVFILREVFAYDYGEIAAIVDRSEANCRQILRRARKHIAKDGADTACRAERSVVDRFLAALSAGDVTTLLELIADDGVLLSDGGPDHRAARRPIVGPKRIARLLTSLRTKLPDGTSVRMVSANAEPTIVAELDGRPLLTMTISADAMRVRRIYVMVNPEKLRGLLPA